MIFTAYPFISDKLLLLLLLLLHSVHMYEFEIAQNSSFLAKSCPLIKEAFTNSHLMSHMIQ